MSAPVLSSDPPRGYFSVWQRLLRGYGPLAVFALMILLLSVLVPSKVPDEADAASADTSDGVTDGSLAPTAAPARRSPPTGDRRRRDHRRRPTGGATGGDRRGHRRERPAGCPDRELQVPGDPYSPPCVAFSGNNGGGTHKGVTGTAIKVAFRVLNERGFQQTLADLAGASLVDSPATVKRTVQTMADYFNKRFQFYGRKIEIVFYDGQGSNTNELLGKGRDKAEADAIKVAEEIGAFADLSATSEPYAGALAKRGVIGFGTPYLSRAWHEQRAPFAWSLATDGSIVSELAAEYQVKRLYGGAAVYAGGKGGDGKDLKGRPRKFATLAPENSWYQESVQNAEAIIRKSGQKPGFNRKYVLDLATMSDQATGIIAQMKDQNITTIVCGCDPILPVFLSGVANREKYFPEFIIVGTALTDADIVAQLWRPGVLRPRVRREPARAVRAAHQDDRLRRLQGRPQRRAGVLRRPHLLPDVHAGDRPPGRGPEPQPGHLRGGDVQLPAEDRPVRPVEVRQG